MKISVSARDEKKLNRRARGDRRAFSSKKAKNKTKFYEYFIFSASSQGSAFHSFFSLWGIKAFISTHPPRMKVKRMNEEEAESAERLF